MRLLTGIPLGMGIVWYTYPHLDRALSLPEPEEYKQSIPMPDGLNDACSK
jgi:hypothetical protein